MSRMTGVFQRHTRTCKRGTRCGCAWAYSLELAADHGHRRQVTKSGFPSQKAAAEARAEAKTTYSDPEVSIEYGRMTVAEWLTTWMQIRTDPHGRKPLRASTAACYQAHIDAAWEPKIGHVRLRDLTGSQIESVHRHLRKSGVTEATVLRYHATLSGALNYAYRKGYIARNPLDRVELGEVTRHEQTIWTLDQWRTFENGTKTDRLYALYRLAVDSGMRRGELLGLRWQDVNLDAGTVTVSVSLVHVGNDVVESTPKTKAGTDRTVHLTTATLTALRTWRAKQAADQLAAGELWTGTDRVFTDTLGGDLVPKTIYQQFIRKVTALELPRMRFHDLRHLSATIGGAAGETPKEMSKRLGHSDPAFTQRVYQHIWEDQAKAGASARGSLLDTGTDA